ncbi:uncharacterized protein PV06_10971 [Exophiala oligosperma]|uniref:DUF7719 domain-containing protein n=2 Tax=Chaetothyriales TaxID=34395 RepID=A0A0D2A943_9EURO|nr:uncharacterized protein PV06_10971 [Exophiala oligosperma]KAJ9613776.1 hypothetical protein H2204_014663 [Knufia peltigerae]KIW36856.1 hypothetical protein PV06_10971 [Exophiala oligosperma]
MNRKQRRNKASTDGHPSIASADDIPLARPDRTAPDAGANTKTLFEIAAERQAKLTGRSGGRPIDPKNIVQVKIGQDGQIQPDPNTPSATFLTTSDDDEDARSETPWLDTILLAMSLSAVHFTLDVLTVHQYAQELEFPPIFARTIFTAFPTLTVVIALFHGLLFPKSLGQATPPSVQQGILRLRQVIYVLVANVAGCYLVALTNDKGYYAVMKDAPSVGTIWVWTVLELGLLGALAGVAGPAMYAWWNEYGIF